CTVGHWYFDVW
nr:immunoglobulin heavy chain junction region [Mus musculus]MBK4184104.1 immunoglobulin heavy chain junction region [Mus musculus]MBK4184105.1 immunoglobulin heavy chain junction region [Mus musculus]